jgi:lipid II:glycine glycyltransferase (peptidoglycan interpeptide bridge formation enzyme)
MHAALLGSLGWRAEGKADSTIYYRQLGPLSIAKFQRPKQIDLEWLKHFRRKHRVLTTFIEPGIATTLPNQRLGFPVDPFAHSSTSLIDLFPSESSILHSFSQKTRYNITHTLKAAKLTITTTKLSKLNKSQLSNFFTLHADWSKEKNVIGYSTALINGVLHAYAHHGDLHLCYQGNHLVGSLLVLYHDHVATYWAAFASPVGYKAFAPTLLTWTAIQTAKTKGCDIFDFGGIYDPRYPKMYKRWIGFTKFKSTFNPTVISYPPTSLQLFW